MKALEKLFNKAIKNPDSDYCEITKYYEKVKSALERKEKQDEILRIIISKRIDFDKLQRCANAYEYNTEVDIENNEEETTRQHITQEEYDTLEEMGLIY